MTASIGPWPTAKPETRNRFNDPVMNHRANADFWNDYHALPADIRARADKQFALLKKYPQHRSRFPDNTRGRKVRCDPWTR